MVFVKIKLGEWAFITKKGETKNVRSTYMAVLNPDSMHSDQS